MSEDLKQVHWHDNPNFETVYMPWGESVANSEAAQRLFGAAEKDLAAIRAAPTVFKPTSSYLKTVLEVGEGPDGLKYDVGYERRAVDQEASQLIITQGQNFSIMLRQPSSTGWKVGFSYAIDSGWHPLMGAGFAYSPELLVDNPELRSYIEEVLQQVAEALPEEAC